MFGKGLEIREANVVVYQQLNYKRREKRLTCYLLSSSIFAFCLNFGYIILKLVENKDMICKAPSYKAEDKDPFTVTDFMFEVVPLILLPQLVVNYYLIYQTSHYYVQAYAENKKWLVSLLVLRVICFILISGLALALLFGWYKPTKTARGLTYIKEFYYLMIDLFIVTELWMKPSNDILQSLSRLDNLMQVSSL